MSTADVQYTCDDPIALLAVFAHLRGILGQPDMSDFELDLQVTMELKDEHLETLRALAHSGWRLDLPQVREVREYIRYSDGLLETRRASPSGELLEAPEWRDQNFQPVAPPDAN